MTGTYHASAALANITIAGAPCLPKNMSMTYAGQHCEAGKMDFKYDAGVLRVSGLHELTPNGAWHGEMEMKFIY